MPSTLSPHASRDYAASVVLATSLLSDDQRLACRTWEQRQYDLANAVAGTPPMTADEREAFIHDCLDGRANIGLSYSALTALPDADLAHWARMAAFDIAEDYL